MTQRLTSKPIRFLLLCLMAGSATAAEPNTFHIPAGDLAPAVAALIQQSGAEVLYQPAQLAGLHTKGVEGRYSTADAAAQLLAGTPLQLQTDPSGAMVIAAKGPKNGNAAPSASDAPRTFAIPRQALATALDMFRTQSGAEVTADATLVAGRMGAAVKGSMTPAAALKALLRGSGLRAEASALGGYALKPLSSAATTRAGGAEGAGGVLAEHVLIEGQREHVYEPGGNVDIARTVDDAQPYYVFDAKTIEQSGATSIEEFLKTRLTMNSVVQTNAQAVPSPTQSQLLTNTSSVNLRGLGANETLVLIDGHRAAGVNIQGAVGQPDLNGLPMAAIDRIEVLPSSASAIYGGSALGGVINIILKKNYSGGDLQGSYADTWDRHSPQHNLSAAYGFGFEGGKSHFMVTVGYSDSKPLHVGDRVALINRGYSSILQNDPGFFNYDPTYQSIQAPLLGSTSPRLQ